MKVQFQQEISHGLQPVGKNKILKVLAHIFAYPDSYREAKIVTKQNTEDQVDTKIFNDEKETGISTHG